MLPFDVTFKANKLKPTFCHRHNDISTKFHLSFAGDFQFNRDNLIYSRRDNLT